MNKDNIYKWVIMGVASLLILGVGIYYTLHTNTQAPKTELSIHEESTGQGQSGQGQVSQSGQGQSGQSGQGQASQSGQGQAGQSGPGQDSSGNVQSGTDVSRAGSIYVYVCGAVVHPDVYVMSSDARVCDAVNAAGGMREDANPNQVNLALNLADGQMIYIPIQGESVAESNPTHTTPSDTRIDLNHADVALLMTLPGIGEAKAKSIVEYREANGFFVTIEDVTKVSGIGEAMFRKMKDYIRV